MSDAVVLALIAIVGTVITALFKLLNDNTKALTKVASSSEKVAAETAKGNREAKQRNGHLGEQNIQITQMIADQQNNLSAIRESSQSNAESNAKAVKVLEDTAATLKVNTDKVSKATEEVARLLKKSEKQQVIDQQTVVHQLVKNKE